MDVVKENSIGKAAIKAAHGIVNFTVLTVILLLVAFAVYAIWDSNQVYYAADAAQYAVYKPSAEDSISFAELQVINPEVFSWLTVYGTNIDYPITQGADNMKYVNTSAKGAYSLSGSIFLDYTNDKNFSDFNSILYGHHMEKQAMFGELGSFSRKQFFDSRAYGNLYYAGKDHGLEFFAFIKTDAYDHGVFTPGVQGLEVQQAYLDNLLSKAIYTRDIGVSAEDHILLLTTCATDSTNGRDILAARITDECYANTFKTEEISNATQQASVDRQPSFWGHFPAWLWIAVPLTLLLLIAMAIYIVRRNRAKG